MLTPEGVGDGGWPSGWPVDGIAFTVTTAAAHAATLAGLVSGMTKRFGTGLVVTASRPAPVLRERFSQAGILDHELRYLDCVSMAGGLRLPDDGRIMHLPSPGLLELIALRAQQWLERLPGRRFLVVDSLSTLALHNGVGPVTEFVHDLTARLRRLQVPVAFVVIDGQVPALLESLEPPASAVVRL